MPLRHASRRSALLFLGSVCALSRGAWAEPPPQLLTGDLPPFAIAGEGAQRGVLIELAEAVLERAGWPVRAQFLPWARAVQQAQLQQRHMVLPLTRTPAREAQFQWLVRLSLQHFTFLSLPPVARVVSLDQARLLKVGVLRGSPHHTRLLELGFDAQRQVQASSNDDLQRMLRLGMVEAIYGSEMINLYNARLHGQDLARLQVGMTVESGEIWLAGNGFGEAEVSRMRQAAAELEAERLGANLFQRYGLEPPRPRP